jgi:hypothetical protein
MQDVDAATSMTNFCNMFMVRASPWFAAASDAALCCSCQRMTHGLHVLLLVVVRRLPATFVLTMRLCCLWYIDRFYTAPSLCFAMRFQRYLSLSHNRLNACLFCKNLCFRVLQDVCLAPRLSNWAPGAGNLSSMCRRPCWCPTQARMAMQLERHCRSVAWLQCLADSTGDSGCLACWPSVSFRTECMLYKASALGCIVMFGTWD